MSHDKSQIDTLISRYSELQTEQEAIKRELVIELTRIRDNRIYLLRGFDTMKAYFGSLPLPFSLSTYKSARLNLEKLNQNDQEAK